MNHETLGGVLAIAALAWLPMPGSAQDARGYSPVSQQRLLNPEPENWLMFRRTYDGWGYSPLDQINADNVQRLTPVWAFSTGITEGHQAPPVVNDGVMFITTPGAQVYALDARTGEQLWRYRRQLPFDLMQLHPTNRGVGLHEDKVLVATVDAFVVALNARTGEVEWETSVEDYRSGYYMTLAPLVADGHVMVGVSGGEFGIRGFVIALDADTGEEVWKTYTIPAPGEFGNDTWPGDSWRTGGAPVWVTGTYDPELNLSFWGTGNPGPWIGDVRPGDNLYTNSVLAIDVRTGALRGYHQYHWNGSWDWDEVSPPILMDLQRDGRTVKALVHAGRNGYLWELERTADGIGFVDARAYVTQNVFTAIDPDTGRPAYDPERKPETGRPAYFCPSLSGGKNWPPAAYSPQTGYLYIPANENLCSTLAGEEVIYRAGQRFVGADIQLHVAEGADHIGELQAWDMATGERVWTHEFELNNWGPVLATGGGLVFLGGTPDRYFRAFDATTGEVLWQQRTNSGITGVPSTYSVDGVQYVAVQSGWGVDAQRMLGRIDANLGITTAVPQGGVLWVFALGED
ncbi:MAG: methanol/ethanol family PQQ-dependent dehydrogenase [Rhodospirillaceae bacterium]|nr:methanol/ethanol family PQQ-dependent dehydrogenase [Rhodospirillaceae bacterium]